MPFSNVRKSLIDRISLFLESYCDVRGDESVHPTNTSPGLRFSEVDLFLILNDLLIASKILDLKAQHSADLKNRSLPLDHIDWETFPYDRTISNKGESDDDKKPNILNIRIATKAITFCFLLYISLDSVTRTVLKEVFAETSAFFSVGAPSHDHSDHVNYGKSIFSLTKEVEL